MNFILNLVAVILTMAAALVFLGSLIINLIRALKVNKLIKLDPDFVVRIGKPLLPITFSISQRIEFLILIITQSIGSLICLIKAVVILLKKPETEVKWF